MRFYALHCVVGFPIAGVFVAALMYFNAANLWHLISASDIDLMELFVFWVLNGIVFAGVQAAVAVMMMAENPDQNDDGPRGGMPTTAPVPTNSRT